MDLTYEGVLAELDEQMKSITEEQAGSGASREHVFQEAASELEMGAVLAPAGTGHLLAADLLETRAQLHEQTAEVSRLRVELEAIQDDRDEARHALRECARELKAAEERLESIRMDGIEASEREL